MEEGKPRLELFNVFGFKSFSGINEFKETLESRAIPILMEKNVRPVEFVVDRKKAKDLRSRLLLWRFRRLAYQFIGLDELPEFEESQYRFLFSRLRRLEAAKHIPLRMRATGNPMGVGVEWVKRRFINPETAVARFIPARLEDNPYLDRESYMESLNRLDPITRRRLLEGDWTAYSAGMFRREWFQVVSEIPAGCRAVRYWDLAATPAGPERDPAYTARALVATKSDGVFYIVDIRRIRGRPAQVEALVRQTAELDETCMGLKHVGIYMEQEPGSSGVNTIDHYARNVLAGFTFRGHRATGSKELRAAPVSSAAEAGNVKLVRDPWINDFLEEMEAFPESRYKDQVDAVSGAFNTLTKKRRRQPYVSRVF